MYCALFFPLLQVPARVVTTVENFLGQCGSGIATNEGLLWDYLVTRLESLIADLGDDAVDWVGILTNVYISSAIVHVNT